MKRMSLLGPRTVTISIVIVIVLSIRPISLVSQGISTVGEIYNYEINDVFHYEKEAGSYGGYYGMWSVSNIKIIDKYHSTNSDTVFYVRDVDYQEFIYPDSTWINNSYVDTIYYTSLSSLINSGNIDTVYSNLNLFNGRTINYKSFSSVMDETYTFKWVAGCGMALNDYYREFQSYSTDKLVYFKKGDEEWGTPNVVSVKYPDLTVGIYMYPNPAKDMVHIRGNVSDFNSITIYPINGTKIMSVELTPTQKTFDISELAPGLYIVKFNINGTTVSKILIKE